MPDSSTQGAVATLGDWSNGWALYLLDGRPVFALTTGAGVVRLAGADPLAAGDHTLTVTYRRGHGGGGPLALAVDDDAVDQAEVVGTLPFRWQIGGAGLLVGRHAGFPVHTDYTAPFEFGGTIDRVVLATPALAPTDADITAEIAAALRHE